MSDQKVDNGAGTTEVLIHSFVSSRLDFCNLLQSVRLTAIRSALKCNSCEYWTTQPKEQQKCTSAPINCPSGYCSTSSITYSNGTEAVGRGCANADVCLDTEKACNLATTKWNLKSCAGACCNTDNCNNYTPSSATRVNYTPNSATGVMVKFITKLLELKSGAGACCNTRGNTDNYNDYTPNSATGVMVTKFTLSLMVIVGFIFCLT
ncbi:Hypothetical predicted protein [Paramuricea clavata]|uniref:Uncharacterized protein n=1 Tax=Paramuricea clavata TaxID=317549 RepID=A0A7D9HY89_PARCT|nr:Hypothetical predicted protein [Paramuricea clavata]